VATKFVLLTGQAYKLNRLASLLATARKLKDEFLIRAILEAIAQQEREKTHGGN